MKRVRSFDQNSRLSERKRKNKWIEEWVKKNGKATNLRGVGKKILVKEEKKPKLSYFRVNDMKEGRNGEHQNFTAIGWEI